MDLLFDLERDPHEDPVLDLARLDDALVEVVGTTGGAPVISFIGNELLGFYGGQDYRAAAAKYEEAIAADPNLTAAYFFLGNSYDNMYKPSRAGEPETDAYMPKAFER